MAYYQFYGLYLVQNSVMNPALVSNYNSYQPLTISTVNSSNMIPIQNHDLCFCMKSRTFNWLFVIYMDSDKVNELISCRFTCHVSNERHSVAAMFNPHGGSYKKTLFFSKYVYGCILQSWSTDILLYNGWWNFMHTTCYWFYCLSHGVSFYVLCQE